MGREFGDFVLWVFYGLLGGTLIYGVGVLKEMLNSIKELNTTVAKILEKTAWHEREINRHDERIQKIEERHQNQRE